MPYLLVESSSGLKKFFLEDENFFSIGRDKENDLVIEDPKVSRYHAQILKKESFFYIKDLNSRNGTYLNGRKIKYEVLKDKDVIKVGNTYIKFFSEKDYEVKYNAQELSSQFRALHPEEVDFRRKGYPPEFNVVYKFITEISSIKEINELIDKSLNIISQGINASRGIFLRRNKNRFVISGIYSIENDLGEVAISKSILKYVDEKGEAVLSVDTASDDRFQHTVAFKLSKATSVICCPLKVETNIVGILYFERGIEKENFTEKDLHLATAMSIPLAMCIQNCIYMNKIEEEYQFSENVINSLAGGIIVVDLEGKIVRVNKNAKNILKLESLKAGVAVDNLQEISPLIEIIKYTLLHNLPINRKEITLKREEKDIIIGVSTSILENYFKEKIGVIAIFRDITSYKNMEKKTKENEYLALIGQFASGVAHEVRNPLNTIKGFSQLVMENLNNEELKGYLQIAIDEIDRIDEMIEDLLTLARKKEVILEPSDLDEIVEEVITQMAFQIERNNIDLEVNLRKNETVVNLNPSKMKQVFINIIKNAIESMQDEHGVLKIWSKTEPYNNRLYRAIYIQDNGKGIPSEIKDKIFDPFITSKSNGTGLGLAVCKKIISEHEGVIDVVSSDENGTTFRVMLPI